MKPARQAFPPVADGWFWTSARFAPGGQAVVWGQTGIGPHAKDERHYIPSIEPYYRALHELAKQWKESAS